MIDKLVLESVADPLNNTLELTVEEQAALIKAYLPSWSWAQRNLTQEEKDAILQDNLAWSLAQPYLT